jgi:hypothetical protein
VNHPLADCFEDRILGGPGGQCGGDGFGRPPRGPASTPTQRRLALGVHRGDHQSSDQAQVGEELPSLLGFARRVGFRPEQVTAEATRNHSACQRGRRDSRQLSARQQQTTTDLDESVYPGERFDVAGHLGRRRLRQLLEAFQCGPRGLRRLLRTS